MSTDYYLLKNICPDCGNPGKMIAIGKSFDGWCFGLRVYPGLHIHSILDWTMLFKDSANTIKDEYGDQITAERMIEIITIRKWDRERPDDWYDRNQAVKGPNGLARHKIDGEFVIGRGLGPFDYIKGDSMLDEW